MHYLPGQDSDADDSTVQCCGNKPFLTTQAVCCNDVVTSLLSVKKADLRHCCGNQGYNAEESFCLTCGKTKTVVPLSEKALWSCCQNKQVYKLDDSKCCDYGIEKGDQCKYKHYNPKTLVFLFDRRSNKASTSIYKIYAALVKNVKNYSLASLFMAFTQVHYVPANSKGIVVSFISGRAALVRNGHTLFSGQLVHGASSSTLRSRRQAKGTVVSLIRGNELEQLCFTVHIYRYHRM